MHDSLQPAFVLYALQAIANEVVARDEGERSIILTVADAFTYEAGGSVFVDQRPVKDSVRRLFEKEQIVGRPLDQVELNPYRLYTLEEISMRSGWDINTVKRLYQAERLLPYQDGTEKRFRRGPILEALESVNGMSPATKVLLPDDYMSRFHITLKSRGHKLVPLERTLMGHPDRPAYLRDISTNEEMPYLWIPTGEVGHFRTWVTESKVA
jgi:hypothetical protein